MQLRGAERLLKARARTPQSLQGSPESGTSTYASAAVTESQSVSSNTSEGVDMMRAVWSSSAMRRLAK